MASNHRLIIRPRLEDLVALGFFLINLALRVVLRGPEHTSLAGRCLGHYSRRDFAPG